MKSRDLSDLYRYMQVTEYGMRYKQEIYEIKHFKIVLQSLRKREVRAWSISAIRGGKVDGELFIYETIGLASKGL